ncbi:MAG: DUF481 domain-containing protein [Woeseiaceae bacterium]|nr:DUF481 domain-containing protein [Woeseiaceae bacterium]
MKATLRVCLFGLLCLAGANAAASDLPWDEQFTPPPGEYSWVRLGSGEWLKGDIIAIYDDRMNIDSDHFGSLVVDLDDVESVYGQGIFVVSSGPHESVSGFLQVRGNQVLIESGADIYEFDRERLVSVTPLAKQERDRWRGDIKFGLNFREGNTDIQEYSVGAKVQRRTPVSRWTMEYTGYQNETDGQRIQDSHRVNLAADRFTGQSVYWRPFSAQYYKDELQNIRHQGTVDTGLGYHVIDSPRTTWDFQAGIGANYLDNVSVAAGETTGDWSAVGTLGMDFVIELTSWLDYELSIDMRFLEEDAGRYQHHVKTALSSDLFGDLDLDISLDWDRTANPQAAEDGTVPEKDDYRLQIGLSYEF